MNAAPGNGEPATDDPMTRQAWATLLMGLGAGLVLGFTIAAGVL